jgi:CheY-like chemotaxis protein
LQSVFLNLFINARDAMPDGGQLRVATRDVVLDQSDCDASPFYLEPGTYIEALVSDTGTGMDEKTLAKIFEPFFTTKGEGQGTGLGLATAYAAIKNHNGEIHAESQPGTGTSFIIHLPESAAEALPPSEYAMLEHGTGTILLVDDDEVLRTTGRMMLEELGYNVLLARDGSEALAQFEMHHKLIDLTILDMIMPQMSGRDVFRAIRSISPRAKVVLASGFSDRQAVQDLEQEGLYGFLQKPYRIAQLSGIISEAIQKTKGEI